MATLTPEGGAAANARLPVEPWRVAGEEMLHFGAVTPIVVMSHWLLEAGGWWPGKGGQEGIGGSSVCKESRGHIRHLHGQAGWEQGSGDRGHGG